MIPLFPLGRRGVMASALVAALMLAGMALQPAVASVRPSSAPADSAADVVRKGLEQMRVDGALDKCIKREFLRGIKLEVHYPQFDRRQLDEELHQWATDLADRFETEAREGDDEIKWELAANYDISRPGDGVVSVVYDIYSYTGGMHGNHVIICKNYEMASGRELALDDLFDDPAKALELMSAYSRKDLVRQMEDGVVDDMLMAGTKPEEECFSSLRLTPAGISVEFSPYDVAPWAAGPQRVDIPLSELAAAGPKKLVWPQK